MNLESFLTLKFGLLSLEQTTNKQLCMDVSWTVKKAEHQRIDAFELWCWRRLLRVP